MWLRSGRIDGPARKIAELVMFWNNVSWWISDLPRDSRAPSRKHVKHGLFAAEMAFLWSNGKNPLTMKSCSIHNEISNFPENYDSCLSLGCDPWDWIQMCISWRRAIMGPNSSSIYSLGICSLSCTSHIMHSSSTDVLWRFPCPRAPFQDPAR